MAVNPRLTLKHRHPGLARGQRTKLTFFGFLAPWLLGFVILGLLNLRLGSSSWLSPDLHAFVRAQTRVREQANRLQVPALCNSDAHSLERLGQYYNTLNHPLFNEQEVFAALKGGQFNLQKNVPFGD